MPLPPTPHSGSTGRRRRVTGPVPSTRDIASRVVGKSDRGKPALPGKPTQGASARIQGPALSPPPLHHDAGTSARTLQQPAPHHGHTRASRQDPPSAQLPFQASVKDRTGSHMGCVTAMVQRPLFQLPPVLAQVVDHIFNSTLRRCPRQTKQGQAAARLGMGARLPSKSAMRDGGNKPFVVYRCCVRLSTTLDSTHACGTPRYHPPLRSDEATWRA